MTKLTQATTKRSSKPSMKYAIRTIKAAALGARGEAQRYALLNALQELSMDAFNDACSTIAHRSNRAV
jgi:hypothetical protein